MEATLKGLVSVKAQRAQPEKKKRARALAPCVIHNFN
jgi:hypothetical protein